MAGAAERGAGSREAEQSLPRGHQTSPVPSPASYQTLPAAPSGPASQTLPPFLDMPVSSPLPGIFAFVAVAARKVPLLFHQVVFQSPLQPGQTPEGAP